MALRKASGFSAGHLLGGVQCKGSNMSKHILAFCLALVAFALPAYAAFPPAALFEPQANGNPVGDRSGSQAGACSNASAWTMANSIAKGGTSWAAPSCHILYPDGARSGFSIDIVLVGSGCPEGSTAVGASCVCDSGYTEQGGQCVPAQDNCSASAGEIRTVNFTLGWARSGVVDAIDYLGPLKWPDAAGGAGSVCTGGCSGSFPESPFVDAYRSQEPSPQGLYRISADYLVRMGGGQCTPAESDKAHDPTEPNMTCPGYVGTVNGKTVCVGTADKPLPPPVGNEPSRNTGEAPDKGNPSAGPKPSQGEGSGNTGPGRTPANGNGGNDGGPSSAAGTGSGDGTTDKPDDGKEQQNCGAPGQPPCKLDESGTPGTFSPNSGVKDYKDKMDQQREQIKGAGDGVFSGLNVFFSAPPVVGCSPFSLPNEMGAIDPCGVVDGVRTVMAYLWAIAALWLCLGWIREAV